TMSEYGVSSSNEGIGPNNFWQAWWLTTQNAAFCQVALEGSKVCGEIPWHTWNPNTGNYWTNEDDHYLQTFRIVTQAGISNVGVWTADQTWQINGEHYPDLCYISYLFTGRRYFLDQLIASTLWVQQQDVGAAVGGNIVLGFQYLYFSPSLTPRTQGWGFRNALYCCYAQPDNNSLKSFFRQVVDNNLNWVSSQIDIYQSRQEDCYGWLPGDYGTPAVIPAWEIDYCLYTICLCAMMGHPLAQNIAIWASNFRIGMLTNGSDSPMIGFPPVDSVMYDSLMYNLFSENLQSGETQAGWWWPSSIPAKSWAGLEQNFRLSSYYAGLGLNNTLGCFSNTANCVLYGSLDTSGNLSVESVVSGSLEVGMLFYAGYNYAGLGNTVYEITSGSGLSWETTWNAGTYDNYMMASNYFEAGEYPYYFTGSVNDEGGNLDDYANLLYSSLIMFEVLGILESSTAINTLLGITDILGNPLPSISTSEVWQNGLVLKLASRTLNDSTIFPLAGGASNNTQAQSLSIISPLSLPNSSSVLLKELLGIEYTGTPHTNILSNDILGIDFMGSPLSGVSIITEQGIDFNTKTTGNKQIELESKLDIEKYNSSSVISLDNSVTAFSDNSTSLQVTISTAGINRLIVVVAQLNGAGTQPTISDTAGLTWTLRANGAAFSNPYGLCEWTALAAAQLSNDVITVTQEVSNFIIITAVAISGVNMTSPYDPNASCPNVNTSGSGTPVISTDNADDFILAAARYVSTSSPSAMPEPWVTLYNDHYWQVGYWLPGAVQSELSVPTGLEGQNGSLADAFVNISTPIIPSISLGFESLYPAVATVEPSIDSILVNTVSLNSKDILGIEFKSEISHSSDLNSEYKSSIIQDKQIGIENLLGLKKSELNELENSINMNFNELLEIDWTGSTNIVTSYDRNFLDIISPIQNKFEFGGENLLNLVKNENQFMDWVNYNFFLQVLIPI
ncbi:MAG: hypothetical protein ACRDFB_07150, partial [Rhabdochlamydiaceae bacterium]